MTGAEGCAEHAPMASCVAPMTPANPTVGAEEEAAEVAASPTVRERTVDRMGAGEHVALALAIKCAMDSESVRSWVTVLASVVRNLQQVVSAIICASFMGTVAPMHALTVECVIRGGMPSTFKIFSFDQYSGGNQSITVLF